MLGYNTPQLWVLARHFDAPDAARFHGGNGLLKGRNGLPAAQFEGKRVVAHRGVVDPLALRCDTHSTMQYGWLRRNPRRIART